MKHPKPTVKDGKGKMTPVGSGAYIARTSTAFLDAYDGQNLLPPNFFGSTSRNTNTPDITVDLVGGKFTVSNSGWYSLNASISTDPDTAALPSDRFAFTLYRNGAVEQWGDDLSTCESDGVTTYLVRSFSGHWVIYLAAGDYVQLGYNAKLVQGGKSFFTGEATGVRTYFNIALVNRSLA